ncbi:S1-like domain-containing RNA-binding protein [Paracrocinitomix mangrovi]|uniref:CvfB family protein n=1 Tax=Paracrocinitomix mangrovi TaxID=2862509 RepID=UPI001C8D3EE9|nr:S1-like domain-containing RNA-binding protein [Paracrocinitomix mangrovi]UKN02937.1 S1-like domain-containing RNA-binding protein [Paracrocinitomix mangrovi]
MVEIGKINTLKVVKEVDFGLYLDGGEDGEILLPKRYVEEGTEVDHFIDVFIYVDSEDRLIATTEEPLAEVDQFAYLKAVQLTKVGAFLDWGLMKDLLVPFNEQREEMREGQYYLVYVYLDEETDRIVASSKVNRYLNNVPVDYEEGQEVDLIVMNKTDLGVNVIINNLHTGLIYENEIFQVLQPGEHLKGFIKKLREDDKIDVALQPSGYEHITGVAGDILRKLQKAGGYIEAHDKSSPETIKHMFGISKKVFKKAIGALYKDRLISIDEKGIRLKN